MNPTSRWSLLVLIALAVRLLVALPGLRDPQASFFRPDSWSYYWPAESLLERGGYHATPEATEPGTTRPPGFPVVMVPLLALGGVRAVVVGMCVLSALTCLPIWLTGRRLGGERAARRAGLLWALNLTSLAAAPMVLSDTLYAFGFAWQLFLMTRYAQEGRPGDLACAALLAGATALVRSAGALWIVPWILLALGAPPLPMRRRVACAAGGVLIFGLCVVPWMLRNRAAGAGFSMDSTVGDRYDCLTSAVLSAETGEPTARLRERWTREDGRVEGEERLDRKRVRFEETARAHPWTLLQFYLFPRSLIPDVPLLLEHFGVTRPGRGSSDVLRREGVWAAALHYLGGRAWLLAPLAPLLAVVAATYAGCAWQAVRWVRERRWFWLLMFGAFVLYPLVLPGPMVEPRYQLPALPLMAVMAALAAERRP